MTWHDSWQVRSVAWEYWRRPFQDGKRLEGCVAVVLSAPG